jgi:hypothetical protein
MLPAEQPLSVPYNQKSSQIPTSLASEYTFRSNILKSYFLFDVCLCIQLIILSMHFFFPAVGMVANVSPMEQHFACASVQFACQNCFWLIVMV